MARRWWLASFILAAALVLATGGARAAGVEPSHEIRLLNQRFTPPAGVPEAARQAIGRRAEELRARGKERLHLLVQLHELPSSAGRQELARQGLDLGAFVPGSAFIAAVPVGRAVAAVANPRVRWATLWKAGHKLHPRVAAGDWAPWARDPERPERVAVMLLLHHDVPLAAGPALAEKVGGVALPAVEGLHGMTVWLPQKRVAELAAEEEVLWIEEAPPPLTPRNKGVWSGNAANNGYPCEREGDYGVSSSLVDGIAHGTNAAVESPMLMTWAAGNERNDGDPRGRCGSNYGTMAPPACAKNPIHVGAVNSDGLAMTEFSSWGPCDDGRLKPTVVAPGCETGLVTGETSIHSSTNDSDSSYDGLCGTSMAAPAVARAAELLVEAWREQGHGGPNDRPSPALIKALLIHTARDLGPEGPDYIYGYGAVDVKAAIDLLRGSDSFSRGWITGTVEQGEIQEHYINGPWKDLDEAKVTLVWDDPAAAPFAAEALVNDLTLEYSNYLNSLYEPWVLNPANPHLSATTGVDSLNNVEQIVVRDAPASETLMRVTGTRVPNGAQSYALVFSFNPVEFDKTACTVTSSKFETGTAGWTLAGAVRTPAPAPGHGAESLHLGGAVDDLHEATRQVVVPNEMRAELSFWSYMTTEESLDHSGFGHDPFTAEIRDQAGAVLAVVDLRNDGWPQERWIQQRIDLKPWAGQTVTVAFTATNDIDAVTTFWVDDVTVTTCPKISNTGGSTAPVVVVPVDDPPVAVDDAATVAEDDPATAIPVLANDTDPDGGPISITSVTQPANGTVVITGGGTGLTYQPNADYCNTPPGTTLDTFTYTLTPGGSVATVTVTVICVDDAPTAVDDATTVAEDDPATAIPVLANDTDPDGGPISITSVTQPANGTVVITGGGTGLTYQPNADYCNTPPGTTLDTFTYTLTPGGSVATVTVTVICVDDAPVAVADAATVNEDSGANTINVLANDTDPDGGPISITSVMQPANGTVVITGGGTGLTYQPNANYCNTPPGTTLDTFTYTLTPGGSTATVWMTVTCVNDAPTLTTNPITYTTPGNTQLHVAGATLAGVASWSDAQSATTKSGPSDIDGPGPLQVVAASGSSTNGGSFSITTTGSFTYVPPVGFTGTDSFTYAVTDNGAPAATVTGTINITVGQRIWYIRDVIDANNAAGGDGRSNNAFDSITAFNAATTNDGDIIFIFEGNTGTTPLTGSITLRNGQKLWGQGIPLDVPGLGTTLVSATNKPRIRTTTASTNVVSVPATAGNRTNVEIRGLDLEATGTTSNAIDVTSSGANNVGVTINTNNVRGATAEGIDVNAGSTGTATIAIHDNTLTSNGTAIDITRTAGTVVITTFDDNVISGDSTGNGIVVTGPATFDAVPGGALNPVSGGTTVIGASGNAITGAGLSLGTVTGALDFTDLDVFAGTSGVVIAGTGAFTGATGTRVTVPNGVSIIQAGNGPGVDVSNATIDLRLASLTVSASPTTGVSLINVSDGTVAPAGAFFSAGSGSTIANVTGTDFNVDGGNSTVTYAGSINNTAGRSVSVQNRTSDSVTFTNTSTITDNGTGILVNANAAGAVTEFLGTLTLNTGVNAAFVATSGGTLRVMGAANTITTTTAVALNVTNTTVGTGSGAPETGLRFRSIAAGTAASGPTNGIVLNNTGALGGLTITGVGTADSGGTIQNTVGSAILATNTQDLSLTDIRISAPGRHGIEATNLRGTCLLASSTITGFNLSTGNGYRLVNNNTNLTKLTISASTFSSSATGNDGLFLEAQGTSNMTVSVESSCTFTGLFGDAIDAQTITGASGNVNLTVKNSTFNNAAANGNNGISLDPFGGPVNFTFDIATNVFDTIMRPATNLGAINVTDGDLDGGGPTVTGTIQNNTLNNIIGARGISMIADTFAGQLVLTINNNEIDRLGSISKHGIAIDVRNNVPNADVTVTNNRIGQAANLWTSGAGTGNGILLQTQNSATMDALLSGNQVDANTSSGLEVVRVRAINSSTLNATVTGNDLQDTSPTHVELGALTGTGGSAGGTICLNTSGNTVPAAGVGVIRITENAAPGTINVTQASAAAVAAANSNATVTVTGTPTFGVPACPLP